MKKNKYEILAPAGSFESLVAGINCGCNAVYLGGEKFSARSKAINFSNEELIKAVNYAHLRNVKIYVTLNILIDDKEMKDALEFARFLNSIGVDALIVQDLGFASIARKLFPEMEIHASTQMAINNFYGAKFVENLGFERVVLARETDLNEINRIKENTNLDIEAFVHGALCVAFSGECLMSSMIGGRSGNRGECAQACRKRYEIYDLDREKIADEAYFLSTKDLNTLDSVDDLVNRGVYSLKIEGRMKRPEYVAQIVSSYKKSMENKLENEDYENTTQIFNRGFTKGLFNNDFGRDFISYDRPDNRGLLVGEVVGFNKGSYILSFYKDIKEKDGLEFKTATRNFGIKSPFSAKAGQRAEYKSNKKIEMNSKIYKTSSEELLNQLNDEINKDIRFQDINIYGEFLLGKKPKLIVKLNDFEVVVEEDSLIEEAKKAPLSEERIVSNLTKLGDTVYNAKDIEIKLDDNIFMPVSTLNSLRRKATELLDEYLLINNRKDVLIDGDIYKFNKDDSRYVPEISAEINNLRDLEKVNKDILIYMDIRNINKDIVSYVKDNDIRLSVVFPKFQNSKELESSVEKLDKFIDIVDSVTLNNLSQVEIFKNRDIKKIADIGLNVFNSYTAREFINLGFDKIILSPELNVRQIKNIANNIGNKVEVVSHGLIPVMTMPHCLMSIVKNCKDSKNCSTCRFSKGFFIRDTMEVDFLVERRDAVSEVFNSYPIVLLDKIDELKDVGVSFKLNIREDVEDTLNVYENAIKDKDYNDGKMRDKLILKYKNITFGHYNRGIINE